MADNRNRWWLHEDTLAIDWWNKGESAEEISWKLPRRNREMVVGRLHRLWKSGDKRIIRTVAKKKFTEQELWQLMKMTEPSDGDAAWTCEEAAQHFKTTTDNVRWALGTMAESEG